MRCTHLVHVSRASHAMNYTSSVADIHGQGEEEVGVHRSVAAVAIRLRDKVLDGALRGVDDASVETELI